MLFSKSNIKKTIYLVSMGEGLLPGSEWKKFWATRKPTTVSAF